MLSPVETASPLISAWVVLYDGLGSALTRDTGLMLQQEPLLLDDQNGGVRRSR